ncbi:MAG: hypothetical protein KFW09_03650 [Oscillospiraceae bacterium]|nr:hypothetical protein [Oscillospiraceae bacterium]
MFTKIILPILIGSTIAFTSGVAVSNRIDKSELLKDIEQKATKYDKDSDIYVTHANTLDYNTGVLGQDINNLIIKIDELKDFNGGLREEIKILEEEKGPESEESKTERSRLTEEIKKAKSEMNKAQDVVIQYYVKLQEALRLSKYKYIDIGIRFPIEEIVQPEPEGSIPGFNTYE